MSDPRSSGDKPADRIALWLSANMCLLPFLVPYHQFPLKSFHAEWLAAALGVCAAIVAIIRRSRNSAVPGELIWLGLLAALLLYQAIGGHPVYAALPLVGILNVAYAALMIWLGRHLVTTHGVDAVTRTLAFTLLLGALANAAAGLIQYYGRPVLLEDLVAALRNPRIYGNIGQTNLFANYLAVGLAALMLLWRLGAVHRTGLFAGAALLNIAGALAGSRAWILYLVWLVVALLWSGRHQSSNERHRLLYAGAGLLAMAGLIQALLPWLNEAYALGPQGTSGLSRVASVDSLVKDSRWQAWEMAWRIFLDHPLTGVGLGEFAGAAFATGMPPFMAFYGDVWTSPHNLVLQMLAETGIIGALASCGVLAIWWWRILQDHIPSRTAATGFLIAAVGIETIQSLLEYPFWNVHFLGLAALLMGVGIRPSPARGPHSRWLAASLCAPLVLGLYLTLRDHVRMDSVLITGTAQTLMTPERKQQDQTVMREVAQGLLGPVAELWMTSGAALEEGQTTEQLPLSERVQRFWPSVRMLARHVAWLSFAGRHAEAATLLDQLLRTYPFRCGEITDVLNRAAESDPAALAPAQNRMAGLVHRCQANHVPD